VPRDLVITLPLLDSRPAPALQELRQSFQDTLMASEAQRLPITLEEEFHVATVPPRVARRRAVYQLDHGVQLSGEQEALERLFAQPPHRVGSSTEFTIRTTTFRHVL
jgi:hypothetical protein